MKVSIVTVYNSENCGSYWQAYALKKTLEKQGHEVHFFKRNRIGSSHSPILLLARTAKYALNGNLETVKNVWKQYRIFSKMQKNFLADREKADAYVIGSDTLWSIEQPAFRKKFDLYSGMLFPAKTAMTYAVSAGNATEEMFGEFPDIRKRLSDLAGISVRDAHTERIAKRYTDHMIQRVLDPTLLLERKDYLDLCSTRADHRYILIYTFQALSEAEWESIKTFSEEKQIDILIYGRSSKYQKKSPFFSPDSFISAFANAQYVVTDTFHGTVFSMLFHRQFVCLDHNKVKVTELVEQFGFRNRLVQRAEQIVPTLNDLVEFEQFESIREEGKKQAIEYLNSTLEKIKNKEIESNGN